ncbi:MAG: helix-turn-helix transcriptional regulator, partial [Treponema sp.]|nr:helix-turn-helix transcriptional regulator [Treponema sp.]
MDMVKIGKFIAQCRKEKNLTQAQLAEKFGITDRAVSKWETGNSLPDASIMLELCELLSINVNELLKG